MSKGSPFWHRRGCSATTSESGDNNLTTSRRWQSTSSFSPSALRAENSGNNRRKRGVHWDIAKHLQCNTSPSRRAPWYNRRHPNNQPGDASTDLRSGRNGTRQCSRYQIEICGHGTVVTYDCDHERHAGATKIICLCTNQPSKAKKEAILLDLQEQFHSREKNLLIKESGTPRWSVLQ